MWSQPVTKSSNGASAGSHGNNSLSCDTLLSRKRFAYEQAVGDALSGILLVEAALRQKRWSLQDWLALYADLPSRQLKVGLTYLLTAVLSVCAPACQA